MSKFVVFSDLHAHNFKKFNSDGKRLQYCLKVIEDVFELAAEQQADGVLFVGDLYDQQQALPTVVVNKVIATLKQAATKYPNIPLIAISGNHDHATKNTGTSKAVSALEHLQDVFEGWFELIDNEIYEFDDAFVYGIPYYENPNDFQEKLLLARTHAEKHKKMSILMIHQTPAGIGNEMIVPDTKANDPAYAVFDMVLCGHIHQHQRLSEHFYVVGSPLHRDLGDEGDKKSIMLLEANIESGITAKRIFTNYPEYIRVDVKMGEEPAQDDFNYIIPVPVIAEVLEGGQEISQSEFGADLAPAVLLENYAKELLGPQEAADYMTVGKKLLLA